MNNEYLVNFEQYSEKLQLVKTEKQGVKTFGTTVQGNWEPKFETFATEAEAKVFITLLNSSPNYFRSIDLCTKNI